MFVLTNFRYGRRQCHGQFIVKVWKPLPATRCFPTQRFSQYRRIDSDQQQTGLPAKMFVGSRLYLRGRRKMNETVLQIDSRTGKLTG